MKRLISDYGLCSNDWFSLLSFIVGVFVLLVLIIFGLRVAFGLLKYQHDENKHEDDSNENEQSGQSEKTEFDKYFNKVSEDKSKILILQLKACLLQMDYAIGICSKNVFTDNKLFIEAIIDYGNALYRSNEILTILSKNIREKVEEPIGQMRNCLSELINAYATITTINDKDLEGITNKFKTSQIQIETVLNSKTSHVEKQ